MIDNIILVVEKCLISLFAVIGYFYLVCSFIPHLTLRPVWRRAAGRARGLMRVSFDAGRGVVYETDPHVRRYMQKYALVLSDGYKFLQCCINPQIHYLRYDVATFDRGGKLLDIVRVCERPTEPGLTRRLPLPSETSHAYVILRCVDGMYRNKERIIRYSPLRVCLFFLLNVLSTVAASILLYDSVVQIWALCYPSYPRAEWIPVLLTAVVMGVICAGVTLLRHRRRIGKAVNQ